MFHYVKLQESEIRPTGWFYHNEMVNKTQLNILGNIYTKLSGLQARRHEISQMLKMVVWPPKK